MHDDSHASERESELANLRFHWQDAYILAAGDDGWSAMRRDNGEVLHAGSADELREAIRADYDRCPVPRSEKISND